MDYKILSKLQNLKKDFYSISDLEKIFNQKRDVLYVTLNRLLKKKWITRIQRGLYRISILSSVGEEKIASQLYLPNYLSFESALSRYGIIDKIPYTISFATTRKTKMIRLENKVIEFRQIKKEIFFGFSLKDGVNIASPEKALLDQIYFVSRGKGILDDEELNLKGLDKNKFLKYAKTYPKSAQKRALKLLKRFGRVSVTIG